MTLFLKKVDTDTLLGALSKCTSMLAGADEFDDPDVDDPDDVDPEEDDDPGVEMMLWRSLPFCFMSVLRLFLTCVLFFFAFLGAAFDVASS